MNKKGNLGDGIWFMVVIFVVAIVSVVGWTLMKTLDDDFQANSQISSQGKTIFSDLRAKFVNLVDNAFAIIFIGLFLAILVGAWSIKNSPVMFYISIPILAFIVFMAALYGNFFDNFANTSDFSDSADDFSVISFIMGNYVFVILIVIMALSLVLFSKNRLFE